MVVNQQNMEVLLEQASRAAELAELCLTLRRKKTELEAQLGMLEIHANNEQLDVEKLEGLSVKSVLLWLAGKRSTILEIERQEAEEARQECEAAKLELDAVTQQLELAQQELDAMGDCSSVFAAMVKEVPPGYRTAASEDAVLLALDQKLADLERLHKALEDTIVAGTVARKKIGHVMDDLRVAKEQTVLLGGMSSVSDEDSLNHTQKEVVDLRDELSLFKEAMLDLNLPQELRFDLHDFLLVEQDFLVKQRTNTLVTGAIPQVMARLQLADSQIEAILAYVSEELEETAVRMQPVMVSLGNVILKK